LKGSALQGGSGNPLLGLTRDVDKGFEVIETERSAIEPRSGLILERPREGRCEERFSLTFCQIVALMLPHRSVFAGLLLVAILFPPLLK